MTLDHLLLAGPNLTVLAQLVEERTGLRAHPGGRHLGHGTHNALLGLGEGCYLELLAPDPSQDGGGFRDTIAHLAAPALHTWCARGGTADEVARRVRAAGVTPRRVPMQRRRADGGTLAWELVFVDAHAYGPLVPFFIDWQGTPHPAAQLPAVLELDAVMLEHPDPDGFGALLARLGGLPSCVRLQQGARAAISAELRHAGGRWRLAGPEAT